MLLEFLGAAHEVTGSCPSVISLSDFKLESSTL